MPKPPQPSIKEAVKTIIYNRHITSGGNCGVNYNEFANLNYDMAKIRQLIDVLVSENYAKKRANHHGNLIFYNPNHARKQ